MKSVLPKLPPVLIAVLFGAGCQGSAPAVSTPRRAPPTASIPVLIGGEAVGWSELRPYLTESGGRQAIEELILDRELARRAEAAGLQITPEMLDQERSLFEAGSAGVLETSALLRRARGLGPRRFGHLLLRNALLRALAGEADSPSQAEVRVAYELKYGSRRVLRVMVIPDAARAGQIRDALQAGFLPAVLEWEFARTAFEESVDPSAAAGGFLGAVHELDPNLPEAIRQMVRNTPDGELSAIVLAETGAVLLLPTRTTEASATTLEESRAELLDEIRNRRRRIRMDAMAREILSEARPTVLDPGLNWAWENARSGR